MKSRIAIIAMLVLSLLIPSYVLAVVPPGVEFTMRFVNQVIYTPDSDVQVRLTVRNETADMYRFRIADNRMFSVDFSLRTLTNQPVRQSDDVIIQRNTNQAVFYREISLAPGEEYAFTERVNEYVQMPEPGVYVLQARFYPELIGFNTSDSVVSEALTLALRPGTTGVDAVQEQLSARITQELQRERMPPNDVVSYTIRARQQGDWERFFLYMDLESLLRNNPTRDRRFTRLGEADQQAYLTEFREDLMADRTDEQILLTPDEFSVVRTTYTPDRGTVTVIQRFWFPDFVEVREYTYEVRRRDGIWYIVDYQVRNLGTEERE